MSFVRNSFQNAAAGVEIVERAGDLSAIRKTGCAAAIWHRRPMPGFQSWIQALDPGQLPKARVIIRPENVRQAVEQICAASGTPECRERDLLIDDTAALAAHFAEVMRPEYLRLRFDVVTTNACRKFHIDAITARLVCTYRGTGTQYGTSAFGEDPRRVFSVPPGSPILLRGTLWPESPPSGLRHRSPPIEGTGETRLLLVLDPMASAEEEI